MMTDAKKVESKKSIDVQEMTQVHEVRGFGGLTSSMGVNLIQGLYPGMGYTLSGDTLQFVIRMKEIPTVTHQEKRIAAKMAKDEDGKVRRKPVVYESAELKEARQKFRTYATRVLQKAQQDGAFTTVAAGQPVALGVVWMFQRPKSLEKKIKAKAKDGVVRTDAGAALWKVTKPDTDNLIKLLKDEMTQAGWWHDDAQIVIERSMKIYADAPEDVGIMVTVGRVVPDSAVGAVGETE